MNKLLVIVGPTASGKSELSVRLAKKFDGEIISADSRQIYKGMDLGTGKVPGKWVLLNTHGREIKTYVYKSIAHHCIDFLNPKRRYSAALFQRDAKKVIADITLRGKIPILCGGTAQWINAVVYDQRIPDVKPNLKLRAQLEKKSADALYDSLKKLDPARAPNIDRHNKRRLIRALEIIAATGKAVPAFGVIPTDRVQPRKWRDPLTINKLSNISDSSRDMQALGMTHFETLWLGIKTNPADLYKKIDVRLKQRLKAGMVKEVQQLHKQGLSWKKLESFGLEYKHISLYLQKKLSYDEMLTRLSFAIKHYSKRQMTWWKRNKEIKWITDNKKAEKLAKNFLIYKNS